MTETEWGAAGCAPADPGDSDGPRRGAEDVTPSEPEAGCHWRLVLPVRECPGHLWEDPPAAPGGPDTRAPTEPKPRAKRSQFLSPGRREATAGVSRSLVIAT